MLSGVRRLHCWGAGPVLQDIGFILEPLAAEDACAKEQQELAQQMVDLLARPLTAEINVMCNQVLTETDRPP